MNPARSTLAVAALTSVVAVTAACAGTQVVSSADAAAGDAEIATDGQAPGDGGALAACAVWSSSQKGAGVGAATGSVAEQRSRLLASGGGLTAVGKGRHYVTYFPASYATSATKRVLVALHGTGGSPEAEWNDYKATVEQRGWGFIGLKYLDDATQMYDADETIYANLVSAIGEVQGNCDLGAAKLFLVGFSRGSAKTFAMAYLDHHGKHLFSAYGSHSGGAWQQPSGCAFTKDGNCGYQVKGAAFPSACAQIAPNVPCTCTPLTGPAPSTPAKPAFANTILDGNELDAYAGSRFWLYCGERDYKAGFRNCDEMEMSKAFVENFGGHVEELYEAGDPDGCKPWTGTDCIVSPDTKCGHGSFKNVPNATAHMWSYFESL